MASDHVTKLINLAKFLKGSTTIGELDQMPFYYLHTIYKEYIEMMLDEEKRKAMAGEEILDNIEGM